MNSFSVADELDHVVDKVLAGADTLDANSGLELGELAGIAEELRYLPQPEFKVQLKARVTGQPVELRIVYPREIRGKRDAEASTFVLPSLFRSGTEGYPMQQRSLAASLFMHVTALALVVVSSVWAARHVEPKTAVSVRMISLADYPLPPARGEAHGGGGSGSSEKLKASMGVPPRFSHEQFAPPRIMVENDHHSLTVDPTVIGPPNVIFPKTQTGDLFSKLLIPSNGTGTGGGVGDSHGTGVGGGDGPGAGPGKGGNMGGGLVSLGGGVSAPRPIYAPEPEYSDEARRAKYQGDVILSVVVGADGLPRDVRVRRSLGMGLDEQAMQAVRAWRFQPAMKDGRPVMVQVDIQVIFRLF